MASRTSAVGIVPSVGILILRIGVGLGIALGHGLGKAESLMTANPQFADPLGIGVIPSLALATFGELVCGLLVAVGLGTRLAAIPFAVTMGVAFFLVHGGDPWGRKELAFLYLVGALTIALTGGGHYALDAIIGRRRK